MFLVSFRTDMDHIIIMLWYRSEEVWSRCRIGSNSKIYSFNTLLQESKLRNKGLSIIFTIRLYRFTQSWAQLDMRLNHEISLDSFPQDGLLSDQAVSQYHVSTRRWTMIDQLKLYRIFDRLQDIIILSYSPKLQMPSDSWE